MMGKNEIGKENKTIEVTVEKSHLLTLGERMYGESIELVRELVNNAYDADATEVRVYVSPEAIVVEDNGSGMNEKGLAQFFTVGSKEKVVHPVSPKFGRKRIGQFGIGKFAVLSAADQFFVESRRGKWFYQVIFDREEWEKSGSWELPIRKEPAGPFHTEGTKVTLTKLKKRFLPQEVEKYLRGSVPLKAKKFNVFLNSKRISKKEIAGRHFPVNFKTMYGLIEGEIVIAINPKDIEEPGVECRVKQALIKRELFDFEKTHAYGLNRISGEINTDFLPILANRSDFIRDSDEFRIFWQLMSNFLGNVLDELKKESEAKNFRKISKELKEVLGRIREALILNPDFLPTSRVIGRKKRRKQTVSGDVSQLEESIKIQGVEDEISKSAKEGIVAKLIRPSVTKRIRLKKLGISVGVVSLGKDGPESLAEENLVYINQEHLLYQKFYGKHDLFTLHLARLITKEIVLMKKSKIQAKEAYDFQSKLLTDAFGRE